MTKITKQALIWFDRSFHKRLSKAGISTVEDFLRLVARDLQRLRNVRILDLITKLDFFPI